MVLGGRIFQKLETHYGCAGLDASVEVSQPMLDLWILSITS
ncbi:hypothetical protein [Rubritalea tangerina]